MRIQSRKKRHYKKHKKRKRRRSFRRNTLDLQRRTLKRRRKHRQRGGTGRGIRKRTGTGPLVGPRALAAAKQSASAAAAAPADAAVRPSRWGSPGRLSPHPAEETKERHSRNDGCEDSSRGHRGTAATRGANSVKARKLLRRD